MNTLILYLDAIQGEQTIEKDGIAFSDVCIVKCWIDGEDIDDLEIFKGSLLYFDELQKSQTISGNYLIFTCACGIAEDAGWTGVIVTHKTKTIEWEIEVGCKFYRYVFNKDNYCNEVAALRNSINASSLPLEPKNVIFPFGFHR